MRHSWIIFLLTIAITARTIRQAAQDNDRESLPAWLKDAPAGVPLDLPGYSKDGQIIGQNSESAGDQSTGKSTEGKRLPEMSLFAHLPSMISGLIRSTGLDTSAAGYGGETNTTLENGKDAAQQTPSVQLIRPSATGSVTAAAAASSSVSSPAAQSSTGRTPGCPAPKPRKPSPHGCPPFMKGVTFNDGYNPVTYAQMGDAQEWITFDINAAPGGDARTTAEYIPMMARKELVPAAIEIVNGPNPPEWMLTFNEPDLNYPGGKPTKMTPQEASDAIKPLLAKPGNCTKYVAPVTADPGSPWHDEFYRLCGCKNFFSAYNIHQYQPTSQAVVHEITKYHAHFADKPLWVTEVAPGRANPACSVSWPDAAQFMKDIYGFAANSTFVDRVFWNSGNQLGNGDTNVCNSWLVGAGGRASPLLEAFNTEDCKGGTVVREPDPGSVE